MEVRANDPETVDRGPADRRDAGFVPVEAVSLASAWVGGLANC